MSKEEKARAKLAADPLPASPYLQVGEELILIKCGFSEQLLQLLRWVPKLEWRPDLRGWTLPITAAETLRSVLPEVLRLAEATEEPGARKRAGRRARSRAFGRGPFQDGGTPPVRLRLATRDGARLGP